MKTGKAIKSRVDQSTSSFILTIIIVGMLVAGCICTYGTDKFVIMLAVTLLLLILGMIYAPVSVSASEKELRVNSPFKIHTIPMRRIVSVERFMPTMGAIRLFGSGGFMGHWGIFREGDVGRYVAYYGKSSDCFLVRLDNGDKYVLGSRNPEAMVDYIRAQIK